jgi:outer membrane protein OmpA-like peptidoglycan-associated protein
VSDRAVLPAGRDTAGTSPASAPDDDLRSLRSILIGPAEQQLERLQAKLNDRFSHAREVGAVLPQALLNRARDPELARALMTPVEKALTDAVRKDPKPLADAIFPIIGPAIRKAVAASLAAMVESFNHTLEHSVSWRAVQWRVEALRTGKRFGEVVLLHTLRYRVEQVFLIHNKTGLLLQHVRAGPAVVEDAQLVSPMLTAIRDFVGDSFSVPEQETLDDFRVGDLSVWIERGPSALLAMVTRGNAPQELRSVLQRTLETVHLQYGEALQAFEGDTQAFESSRPILAECLQAEYHADRGPRARRVWILAGVVLLALGVWLAFSVREYVRWTRYLGALTNEPGLVVISSGRSGGRYVVAGLRDPLARDPDAILRQSQLSREDVVGRWEPYQALTPRFVLARAHQVLQPPAGASLMLEKGVLAASGTAPAAWIIDARRIAPLIAGTSAFDATAVLNSSLQARIARIEAATLLFGRGSSTLLAGQDDQLRAIAADIRELDALASQARRTFRVHVVGHTDADGAVVANLPLSRERAERARAALDLWPTPTLDLLVGGVGSDEPLVAGATEADKQRNRRVTFHVTPASVDGTGPRP